MFGLFMSCIMMIIANGSTKVRDSQFQAKMDFFNEIKLMLIMYHLILFTDFISDVDTKFYIGYSCASFLVLSLLSNMIVLFIAPIKSLKRYCIIRYQLKKAKERLKRQRPDGKGFL